MKNVIGIPARGHSFFLRTSEVTKIVGKLQDGNNLNIAAPRRIGKTSILLHLLDTGKGDFVYVYVDTEDIITENEFFKRILKEILRTEEIGQSRKLKSLLESGHKFLGRIKSIKVLGHGIDLHEEGKEIDYKEDLINLLSGIELEKDRSIVVLIDEFPQTVQNIIDRDPADPKNARKFLQANREIRLNPAISAKVRFILTGSIGLNYTVAQIGATAFINDLNSVEIDPLTSDEAERLLEDLLKTRNVRVDKVVIIHLLEKIRWLIPFHIQLAAQEIFLLSQQAGEIDIAAIDRAYEAIVQRRNENHFNHYFSRLKRQFKGDEFLFADGLLELIAKESEVEKDKIINLALKYKLSEKWRQITDVLIYDGYIHKEEDIYRFNSPIVRLWWLRFICK